MIAAKGAPANVVVYRAYMDAAQILFLVIVLPLAIGACALWIWMLVECLTKEADTGNTKIAWLLAILFAQIIGAAIYYFVRRPRRYAELGRYDRTEASLVRRFRSDVSKHRLLTRAALIGTANRTFQTTYPVTPDRSSSNSEPRMIS